MGNCTAQMVAIRKCPQMTIAYKKVEPTLESKTTCHYLMVNEKGIEYYDMSHSTGKGGFAYGVVDDSGDGIPERCRNGNLEPCDDEMQAKAFDWYRLTRSDFVMGVNQTLRELQGVKIPDTPRINEPACDRYFDPKCKGNVPRFGLGNGIVVMGEFDKGKLSAIHFSRQDSYKGTRTNVSGFSVGRDIAKLKGQKGVVHINTELLGPVVKLFGVFEAWADKKRVSASQPK